jgi:hypothetical protein
MDGKITLEEKINEEYKKHPFEFTEDEKRAFEKLAFITRTCPPEFDKVVTEQFWKLI